MIRSRRLSRRNVMISMLTRVTHVGSSTSSRIRNTIFIPRMSSRWHHSRRIRGRSICIGIGRSSKIWSSIDSVIRMSMSMMVMMMIPMSKMRIGSIVFGWTNVLIFKRMLLMITTTITTTSTSHSKRHMIIIHGMILICRNIMIIFIIMRRSCRSRHGLSSRFSFLTPFISRGNDGSMIFGRRSWWRISMMMRRRMSSSSSRRSRRSVSSRLLLCNVDGTIMMLIKDWLIMQVTWISSVEEVER